MAPSLPQPLGRADPDRWLIQRELGKAARAHPQYWTRAATHPGTFAANAQDDVIVLAVCFFHHGLGGGLQGWGAYTNDSIMFRHGLLIETGALESERGRGQAEREIARV